MGHSTFSSTSIEDFASSLGGEVNGTSVMVKNGRLRSSVELSQVALDDLLIDRLVGFGPIQLSGCRIASLRFTGIQLREGLIIEDCEIGNLQVRSATRTAVVVLRSSVRRLSLHACRTVVIDDTNIAEVASISQTQEVIQLSRTIAGSIRIASEGTTAVAQCDLRALSVRERLDLSALTATSVNLVDVSAPRIQMRHLNVDRIILQDMTIEKQVIIYGLRGSLNGVVQVSFEGIAGSLVAEVGSEHPCEIVLKGATIQNDVSASGPIRLTVSQGSRIQGTLQRAYGVNAPQVSVDSGATVRAMNPPAQAVRSPEAARSAAAEMLGQCGIRELVILRESLQERPDEQDMAYFALRQAEAITKRGRRKAIDQLCGALLGWGVTLGHPIRTLVVGVLFSAGGIYGLNPSGVTGGERLINAFTASLGLWFNVDIGKSSGIDGPAWVFAAVACAAAGVSLITITIGVAIRRLTR